MGRFRRLLLATAAVAALALAPRAEAAPLLSLQLDDLSTPGVEVNLVDVGGIGSLIHIGAIGNWILNVTTGTGFPVTGTLAQPLIDLNSINVSNAAGGTLVMRLTQQNLVGYGATGLFTGAIGGTVSSNPGTTLTYAAYVDSTNAAFGTETAVGGAVFGAGAFSYEGTGSGATGPAYSMTQVVTLNALPGTTNTNISFNGELREVPEPTALALLGLGLASLGLARRRKAA